MATQKRKSPKGKGKRRQPGLASRGAAVVGTLGLQGAGMLGVAGVRGAGALGGLIGRHPSIAGGAMAFGVIFSFVAANALWYQPGVHPSPLFRTRDPSSFYSLGHRPFFALQKQDQSNVTTFRIERPDDDVASTIAATTQQTAAAPGTAATKLVADVQAELGRRGIYNGNADGVMGPRTSAAIIFFQETAGLAQTGEASPDLLAALQAADAKTSTVPADRPAGDLHSKTAAVDPVAAAIMNADKTTKTASTAKAPPAPAAKPAIPAKPVVPVKVAAVATPNDAVGNAKLVMQIQKGLSNIAYSDVSIDGVAGDQTKAAIRRFQKHYRLPETGEPDVAVLKKLQDIGAL